MRTSERAAIRWLIAVLAVSAGASAAPDEAASIDLSSFRDRMAADDSVLGRNFDAFAPEAVARAYDELAAR